MGLVSSVTGQASRPLQVESLGAAILTTFGHPQIVDSHGSQSIVDMARSARRSPSCKLPY